MNFPDNLEFVHSLHYEHSEHTEHTENFKHSHQFDFHTDNMAQPPPHERTMSELTTHEFTYDSLCIQYPKEEVVLCS